MAGINTNVGGTWKSISSVACPAVNGTRPNAQAIRIHNGTSWVDIWTSMKTMTLLSNSITRGNLFVYDNGAMQYSKSYAYNSGSPMGSMSGGGTMTFYLDGEWTNPTISFNYEGLYLYEVSTNNYASGSAGSVSVYHRTKGTSSGTTTTVLSKVGSTNFNVNNGIESGTTSKTLTGTYDRLGISFTIPTYSNYNYSSLSLSLSEIKIGTLKLRFPDSAGFYD